MLLRNLLLDYYAPMTGISDRTIKLYCYTISAWADLLGRAPTIADLEELGVARFLSHRVRTLAAATAAKDRAQLRAIWEFAARRKLCTTWPTTPRIIVPERIPEAWMTDELHRLIMSSEEERMPIAGFPGAAVWRALLLLGYESGERIAALIALQCKDVRGCNVIFRAENRKGRRRDIMREISVECADALIAVRRSPEETAIPWNHHNTYLYRRMNIILKRAGLPTDRRSKFHRIRKTTASYYEQAGGSAQRLLDHNSPQTTRVYLDPRIVRPKFTAPDVLPKVG